MVSRHKVSFDELPWNSPLQGVRDKSVADENGLRLRLVEYSRSMPLHWCEKGHWGCLLDGEIEIEFDNEKLFYKKGDGIFIPDGARHRHRARVLGERAIAIFVEGIRQ